MNYSTKIVRIEAKNIVGLITVEKFNLANPVSKLSTFVKSLLVAMVTDAGRAITCRRKFKAPSIQTKLQKMEGPPKTEVITENHFEDFKRKREQKQYSRPFRKNPMENKEPCIYQSIMALVNSKS